MLLNAGILNIPTENGIDDTLDHFLYLVGVGGAGPVSVKCFASSCVFHLPTQLPRFVLRIVPSDTTAVIPCPDSL